MTDYLIQRGDSADNAPRTFLSVQDGWIEPPLYTALRFVREEDARRVARSRFGVDHPHKIVPAPFMAKAEATG